MLRARGRVPQDPEEAFAHGEVQPDQQRRRHGGRAIRVRARDGPFHPVQQAPLALYRDGLGFTEMWREGDATVALSLPGTDVQLMLDANDPDAPVGPLFVVESVEAFQADRPQTLVVVEEPAEIPGGFLATYQDPASATIYVMDQSTGQSTPEPRSDRG